MVVRSFICDFFKFQILSILLYIQPTDGMPTSSARRIRIDAAHRVVVLLGEFRVCLKKMEYRYLSAKMQNRKQNIQS